MTNDQRAALKRMAAGADRAEADRARAVLLTLGGWTSARRLPGRPGRSMIGTLDWSRRKLVVTTANRKRSAEFIAHLERLDQRYGPKPGAPIKPVVIVLDNGPVHTSKASQAALADRAHWLTVEWLPKHAPELNDIEIVWGDLKAHHLAHQTFTDPDALDHAIHRAVAALNAQRTPNPLGAQRISA